MHLVQPWSPGQLYVVAELCKNVFFFARLATFRASGFVPAELSLVLSSIATSF